LGPAGSLAKLTELVRLILLLLAVMQTVPAALRVLPPEFNADKEQQMHTMHHKSRD
jgi:hypothetical protein